MSDENLETACRHFLTGIEKFWNVLEGKAALEEDEKVRIGTTFGKVLKELKRLKIQQAQERLSLAISAVGKVSLEKSV